MPVIRLYYIHTTDVPASAALSIASAATDGVSPMPDSDWKHSWGRPPKTKLKQITADIGHHFIPIITPVLTISTRRHLCSQVRVTWLCHGQEQLTSLHEAFQLLVR